MAAATASYIQENNLPADWKPTLDESTQGQSFDTQVGSAWDAAFEQVIKGNPNAAQLRYDHYNRSPDTPSTPEEQTALNMVKTQYGLPDSYVPTTNPQTFADQANFDYNQSFETTPAAADTCLCLRRHGQT